MDMQKLHDLFAATLAADATVRNEAEKNLRLAEQSPQFADGCLNLLLTEQVQPAIKTAAGVYLKNTVAKAWRTNRPANDAEFRNKLLQGLRLASPHQRPIFLVVLHRIIDVDYPTDWPDLVPKLHDMLASDDVQTVWAGLSGVLKVCLQYRWSSLKDFDAVLASILPLCLGVAEAAVQSDTAVAGSMLYDFAKIYKYSTTRELPALFQSIEVIGRTVQVFVQVLQKPIRYDMDSAEAEYTPWSKAKKWASYNLLRTHVAYVSSVSSLSKRASMLATFRKQYSESLTPHILDAVLKLLEQWSQGNLWLPQPAICNLLTYLEGTPVNKQMWAAVDPYVDGLLQHVIYPLLCPSEEDILTFENEPVEYVHKSANSGFERILPDQAAENLLLQLVQRRKDAFSRVIQFIQDNKEPEGVPPPRRAGILRMLDVLYKVITMKNNPVQGSMETFILQYVLPDLAESSHPIVRSRALHLVGTYATLNFERATLQKLYELVYASLYDTHLPIQVEAARALQYLSENEDVKAAIGEHIPQILQHLLNLTKQIDLDTIMVIMDEFINMHPEQVTPFAVELVTQLRDQFLSTASEIVEASNTMPENFDLDDDDVLAEKKAAATSIIRTVENLQYSLENHKDILLQLESVIMPIFHSVYEHELLDFYPETLALHENTMYCTKLISPQMWSILPASITAIEAGALECLEDATPAYENYIAYGAAALATQQESRDALMTLIMHILSPEHESMLTCPDWKLALQLAIKAFASKELREGPMDAYIKPIIESTLHKIVKGQARIESDPSYGAMLVTCILACIYNSPLSLQILSEHQMVGPFTTLWFQILRDIKSVDSLKLQELAVFSILIQLPADWQELVPQLFKVLVSTVEAFPRALSRLEEQKKACEEDDYDFAGELETENWDDIDDDFPDEKDGIQISNKSDAAFNEVHFTNATHEFIEYDFDDREINPYIQSPLDDVDAFSVLKQGLEQLSQTKQDLYQMAMSTFTENERAILQDGVQRAP